ncbi:hypothetical protein EPH95_06180 [Salicibibacter halophilus]|uniref:Uncharacterized protein n=1 Tax=Salicibibacter halophilus TaxID=2502791 RepID=A0A514LG27_9BACI|nr:hypothetical protein [Salicibibacter halophilus]QDI90814.1 hypothetical protein EPH95_06180 [Salicibibacter halophilus]
MTGQNNVFPLFLLSSVGLLCVYLILDFSILQLMHSALIGLFSLFFVVSFIPVIGLSISHMKEMQARKTGKSVNILLIGIWLFITSLSLLVAIFLFNNPPAF